MITVLSESKQVAKKDYECMASKFILEAGLDAFDYSISELRAIAKAKRQEFKIVKGQTYLRQSNMIDGSFYYFKAIPEIHDICLRRGLYEI